MYEKCSVLLITLLMCVPVLGNVPTEKYINILCGDNYREMKTIDNKEYEIIGGWGNSIRLGNFVMYNGVMYGDNDFINGLTGFTISNDEKQGIYHITNTNNFINGLTEFTISNNEKQDICQITNTNEIIGKIHITAYAGGNKYDILYNGITTVQEEKDPVIVLNGITYFPIRTLCELAGCEVRYIEGEEEKYVYIYIKGILKNLQM